MSKITKPNFTDVWSSAGSKTTPSSLKIQTGWVGEKPPYEYWNWAMNRNDVGAAYSFQMGIAEWDSTVEYQYSASYKSYVQRNGLVYKALQTGTNKNPLTQPTYWALAFDDYGSASTVQSNLNTHITNYGTLASLSNVATARTNLDVYSKAEAAEKNGDATKLFSVANGTTGYEAVNKSQLDTKADVAGNVGQEFAVATATTGNSAINKTQFETKTSLATDSQAGIVEKATQLDLNTGVANVWPDAATIFNGFAQSGDAFTLPVFMGGWRVHWGSTVLGDITPLGEHTTFFSGFSTVSTVLIGSINGGTLGAFTVHRKSFNSSSVTVIFDEWSSQIQVNAGYWWCAIGK